MISHRQPKKYPWRSMSNNDRASYTQQQHTHRQHKKKTFESNVFRMLFFAELSSFLMFFLFVVTLIINITPSSSSFHCNHQHRVIWRKTLQQKKNICLVSINQSIQKTIDQQTEFTAHKRIHPLLPRFFVDIFYRTSLKNIFSIFIIENFKILIELFWISSFLSIIIRFILGKNSIF